MKKNENINLNKENLSDWLETKVNLFLDETEDTIVSYYQDELQRNEDYRGRQLLELLQNSDDAYDLKDKSHKASIELTDTQLIIKNTGLGFTKEGVESLLTSNLSPKDNDYIGNKGLGFRSILNWTKKVHIYSFSKEEKGIWSFSFSRESAIGAVLPAVLSLMGGLMIFLIGKNQESRMIVSISMILFSFTLLLGSGWGAVMRDIAKEYKKGEHYLQQQAFIESEINEFRKNLDLPPLKQKKEQ